MRRLFRWFGSGPHGRRRELDDEIRAHLELRADDLIRRGWDPEEARAEALRRFGDLERARRTLGAEDRRRDWRLALAGRLDEMAADLRLALRRARRAPGFTALALLTLALGVGLTTSVFAAVDRLLLRPLPFPEPDRLVALYSQAQEGEPFPYVSAENWLDWEAGNESFAATTLYRPERPAAELGDVAVRVDALEASERFFEVLRMPLRAGRVPSADEVRAGEALAVVSEAFWRDALGAPERLPVSLRVGEREWRVVGVVASGHAYPAGTDVWLPRNWSPRGIGAARNWINYEAVGRLAPGVGREQAAADLARVSAGIRERAPEALYAWGVGVVPLREHLTGSVRTELLLVLGAVGGVLLLACVNLAGLSLARTLDRAGELGVRVALGAGRDRVVRQLLTEHALLAAVGGALGVVLAQAMTGVAGRALIGVVPGAATLTVDGRVLAFALGATGLAALLAGGVPALRARGLASRAARSGRSGGGGVGASRLGAGLVVAEVALAVVLVTGSALLLRSFGALVARDLGFDADGVLVAELALDGSTYALQAPFAGDPALDDAGAAARRAFWSQVDRRLEGSGAVEDFGRANRMPAALHSNGFIEVEGWTDPEPIGSGYAAVSATWFETLGIPVVEGRGFGPGDRAGGERVALVDRTMAETYWPGESPLGRRVRATSMEGGLDPTLAPWLTVVGVVGDVRHGGFADEASPSLYVVAEQVPWWLGSMYVAVRPAPGEAEAAAAALREAVAAADPSVPVELWRLDERVGDLMADRRAVTGLLTAFGALALGLAAIGVYGLLAFVVAGRTREIGIRAALGAARADVVGTVVGGALRLTLAGIAPGLLAAWWLSGALAALLVDVGRADPAAYVGAALVLVAAALLAALVPAWRASRVDPLEALRAE